MAVPRAFTAKNYLRQNPSWLKTPPWQLDVPDGDDRENEAYNRDVCFYVPLTEKYKENLESAHFGSGDTFSFNFHDYQLTAYFGVHVDEQEEDVVAGLQHLAI